VAPKKLKLAEAEADLEQQMHNLTEKRDELKMVRIILILLLLLLLLLPPPLPPLLLMIIVIIVIIMVLVVVDTTAVIVIWLVQLCRKPSYIL